MFEEREPLEVTPKTRNQEFMDKNERKLASTTDLSGARGSELGVNEKYIQQVLEIEKQADEIYERARREAEQLPKSAEQEANEILERSRRETEEEVRKLLANAQSHEEATRIQSQAEEQVRRIKTMAARNIDMAVSYILDQVAGKE